jgi:AcrR family transcriptional regulator
MVREEKKDNDYRLKLSSERTLSIGQLAEQVSKITGQRCTPAMIYNYERLGLIPAPERSSGGVRLFTLNDVNIVIFVKNQQEKGLSLTEIKNKIESGIDENDDNLKVVDLPGDRRAQILEAAMKVFPEKGYQETTINDIAEEANISSSAIYQYFRNKEDLFLSLTEGLAIYMQVMEDFANILEHNEHVTIDDVRRSLIEMATLFLEVQRPNAEIMRLFISEARRFPQIGQNYVERLISPLENLIAHYIEQLIHLGLLRGIDPKIAAHAFHGLFDRFVITEDLLFGKEILDYSTVEEPVTQLVDIFLQGMVRNS